MADELDACNSPAYINAIDQRKRAQIFNVPPNRYEIINNPQSNPYLSGYSKADLDMRRKAEILEYAPNKRSQTNKITKSQLWAQIVSGQYSRRTYSQSFIATNTLSNGTVQICPPGTLIKKPTSASDVPGPNIYLYKDDTIPLYNYQTVRQYSIEEQKEDTKPWDIIVLTDEFRQTSPLLSPVYSIFSTIRLVNVPNPLYNYTVDIPLTVYVEADVSYNGYITQHLVDSSIVQIWLSSAAITVYYSTSPVNVISTPIFQLISDYNISNKMRISSNMMIYPPSNPNSQDPTKNKFFAYSYFGILRISNIILQAQPGYIYDMKLAVNFNSMLSNNYSTYFGYNNPNIGVYMNTSYQTTQRPSQNCSVVNPMTVSQNNFPQFVLNGNPV